MSTSTPRYRETLSVPLRWWAVTTMFLASVLLAFLVALPLPFALGSVGLISVAITLLFLRVGAATIAVTPTTLHADRARLPLGVVSGVRVLDVEATRQRLGVGADARAYLLVRPYLKRSVEVTLNDAGDPTPYWLLHSRDPEALAAALQAPQE